MTWSAGAADRRIRALAIEEIPIERVIEALYRDAGERAPATGAAPVA